MNYRARRWILDGLTAIVCLFFLSRAIPTGREPSQHQLPTTGKKGREIGMQSSEVRQERGETVSRLIAQDHQSRGEIRKEGAPALRREDVTQQHVHQQSLHGQQFKEHISTSQYYHRKAAPLRQPVKPAGFVSGASEDVSRPAGGCVPLWTCYQGLKSSVRNVTDRTLGTVQALKAGIIPLTSCVPYALLTVLAASFPHFA